MISNRYAPATLNTNGKMPFHPRTPGDLHPGDIIKFSRDNDNRMSRGRVHYVGNLAGHNDVYVGVELEHESKRERRVCSIIKETNSADWMYNEINVLDVYLVYSWQA